jgi:hypothetical protein
MIVASERAPLKPPEIKKKKKKKRNIKKKMHNK